jgi:hypothetical protein
MEVRMAEIRFNEASDEGLSEDLCEPTNIIGTGVFFNAKLNAAAV